VSEAYNTVWTTGLNYKLHTAGIPDSSLLLVSRHTDRKFRVKMEAQFSEWKTVLAGVPQGSVLAALLYKIYVADVARRPVTERAQFANDTAAFTSNKNISEAVNNLQIYIYIYI
jgi:hypothetical protein